MSLMPWSLIDLGLGLVWSGLGYLGWIWDLGSGLHTHVSIFDLRREKEAG